jgi:SAM-dependent methyltransferase
VDDYRAASLRGWSAVAPDWGELADRIDEQLRPAAEWIIDAVAPRPGDRVLELAGGPGTLSILIAERVSPDGTVLHSDFSEEMVKVAWQRFESEGIGGIESRVMDAEQIDLPDGSIDVVVCRMGYMLMADPAAAVRESARVLAVDGRLGLAVWTEPSANPWVSLAMQAIAGELNAPPPPPDAPGLWALGDRQRVEGILRDAGLDQIRIEILDGTAEYESAEQWVEATKRLAGPLRALFANVEQPVRDAIERRMLELASSFAQSDGRLVMPQQMLMASARRLDSR